MVRSRLDQLLHERGYTPSREKARALILAGEVLVNGAMVDKAGAEVDADADIQIQQGPPYVSRGGLKLEAALGVFSIDPTGRVAADVGASTGGFTDCLLQRGAARVYAIDVGRAQLVWSLRQDPRVVVMERTNARYLEQLPEPVDLVTIDVSFISLRLILPKVRQWLAPGGQVIALVKPQFEAGREQVGKGGVVRDPRVHRSVLVDVLGWVQENGWRVLGLARSPIKGTAGNIEFLAHLSADPHAPGLDLDEAIARVLSAP